MTVTLGEKFDSVAVSESISQSSMTNLSVSWVNCCPPTGPHRSCFPQFTRFPLLRRPLFVNVPFWVGWWADAHQRTHLSWLLLIPRAQRYLTFVSGFSPGFLMQSRQARWDPSPCIARPNSSSALILLSPFLHLSSCVLFDILQDNWWNWNGWCWTNTKDDSIHQVWNFLCKCVC